MSVRRRASADGGREVAVGSGVVGSSSVSMPGTCRSDLDRTARPPVLAALPVQEPFVHQVATERGVVVVERGEDPVDLPLLIVDAGFELQRQPGQDDAFLVLPGRDLPEAAAPEVVAEYDLLLLEDGAQGDTRLARRADL